MMWLLLLINATAYGEEPDPLVFDHSIHAGELQISCLFCHDGAKRSPVAGIPTGQTCAGCHQTIATESAAIKSLMKFIDAGEPLIWPRIYKLPDHVRFAHQPHIEADLACSECHGDLTKMTLAEPAVDHTMATCIDCHAARKAPVDCLTCHR